MCVDDWSINPFIFPFLIRSVIAVTCLAFLISYRLLCFFLCVLTVIASPLSDNTVPTQKFYFFHQFLHFPFSLTTCCLALSGALLTCLPPSLWGEGWLAPLEPPSQIALLQRTVSWVLTLPTYCFPGMNATQFSLPLDHSSQLTGSPWASPVSLFHFQIQIRVTCLSMACKLNM